MKPPLFIAGHAGLGDHLICNAIVRERAAKHERVYLPCKRTNAPTVRWMFSDLPNVFIKECDLGDNEQSAMAILFRENGCEYLGLGLYGFNFTGAIFDQCFYAQAGLAFETRWSGFEVPISDSDGTEDFNGWVHRQAGNPEIFVHDDWSGGTASLRSEGLLKDTRRIFYVRQQRHRFNHLGCLIPILKNVKEIHCVNSSIALLVDSIDLPNQPKLYLHHYARPSIETPTFRKEWIHLR